jgi:hypothetical protein
MRSEKPIPVEMNQMVWIVRDPNFGLPRNIGEGDEPAVGGGVRVRGAVVAGRGVGRMRRRGAMLGFGMVWLARGFG